MKKLFILLLISSISCSKDIIDSPLVNTQETENTATNPCDFNLSNVKEGENIVIDCVIDLQGKTINLPKNVTLNFNKGDIRNGTLNFSNNGKIDGNLLNTSVTINGDIQLIDPEFNFYPSRWEIIEGNVSEEISRKNKLNLQTAIDLVKKLSPKLSQNEKIVFSIDKVDAFFGIGGIKSEQHAPIAIQDAIHLPSDFHLKMTKKTFLRVQPSNWAKSLLIGAYLKKNILITGGNLIGDRYTHDYSPIVDQFGISRDSHEFPTLLAINGCEDVLVENVYMTDATGDAFIFGQGIIRTRSNAQWNKRITVRNCTINASRRNNITFGDGEFLSVENCTITNAGGGENKRRADGSIIYSSAGVAPQFGIDLEAYRERDKNDNSLIEVERVEHVTIKGNTFKGNYAGDIVIFTANDVLVENNVLDNSIGGTGFFNCVIRNNILTANKNGLKTSIGIGFNERIVNGEDLVYNNIITENIISGYKTGIALGGKNITVSKNTINDFQEAIIFQNLKESKLSSNTYNSSRTICYGYLSVNGNVKNVTVTNDKAFVTHKPINFLNLNKNDLINTKLTFENTVFKSESKRSLYFENTNNVTLRKCTITGIENVNSTNIISEDNTINN